MGAIAPKSSTVYYTGNYWNDFPEVQREINYRATGNSSILWFDDFFRTHNMPFKKVLVINFPQPDGRGIARRD